MPRERYAPGGAPTRPATPLPRPRVSPTSVGDEPVAGEPLAGLGERQVRRRQDDVRLHEVLAGERRALAAHQLEQLLEDLVEAVLVARLHGGDGVVVELVQAVRVPVREQVLPLGGDADDHDWLSDCFWGSSPAPSACGALPWLSSAFSRARSSSTADCDVSWVSWRSMSSWPAVSESWSSNAPAASSSSIAFARARMFSVLSTARCMAMPTSAISSPTPDAASEIFTCASAAEYCALMTSFLVRNWSILVRSWRSLSMSDCCWVSSSATWPSSDCSSSWVNCLRSSATRARSSRFWASAWRACVSSFSTCCSSFCCWSWRRFLDVTTSAIPFLTFWSSSICFW